MAGGRLGTVSIEGVLSAGTERAIFQLRRLQTAVAALVAAETARHYGTPACEVLRPAGAQARTPRAESRRARDAAIYVLHITLGYPKAQAAQIFSQTYKDAGAKAVRRVEDARDEDPDLDRFLDRLDEVLRTEDLV